MNHPGRVQDTFRYHLNRDGSFILYNPGVRFPDYVTDLCESRYVDPHEWDQKVSDLVTDLVVESATDSWPRREDYYD